MTETPTPMSSRLFFSGKTLQQALLAAARQFGLSPEEIEFVERDRRQGYIKSPRVVIEVDPAAPSKGKAVAMAAAAPAPERVHTAAAASTPPPPSLPPRPERSPVPAIAAEATAAESSPAPTAASISEATEAIHDVLYRLSRLAGLDLAISLAEEGQGFRVKLHGADENRLAQDPALVDAIEQLVPRLLRGLLGAGMGVRVVVGREAVEREQELAQMAQKAARDALSTGQPVVLPRLNSFERRVVHMEIAALSGVLSESRGDGAERRLVILPKLPKR